MTMYKLSIVVPGRRDLGAVHSLAQEPKSGDLVQLNQETFEIVEIVELMPARGDWAYLHATCQPVTTEERP